MAQVVLHLDGGGTRQIVVPVRVGRLLEADGLQLPAEADEAFDAIHALEGKVCLEVLIEMIGRRDHAAQEARDKLARYGFRPQEIDAAIERAEALRLLDDGRFAATFIEQRKLRGWGRRKIELELTRRGVRPDELAGYPEAYFSEGDDLARARELLARKPIPQQRAYERLVRHLMSKGFSYGVAADAVRERLAFHDEDEGA